MEQFDKRLRVLLAERGWTQSKLANTTGIDKSEISRYCKGATRPKLENLRRLADALSVAIVALEPSLDVSSLPPPPHEIGEAIHPSINANSALESKVIALLRSMSHDEQLDLLVYVARRYGPKPDSPEAPPDVSG